MLVAVRFSMLGPLQVMRDGVPVDIGPPKQRAVLAALLLAAGRVVSVDRLIASVWGDDPPATATANLQVYISNLRRALRDGGAGQVASPIVRQPPGYYLNLSLDDVDLVVFTQRCAAAATAIGASQWHEALEAADAALGLWRGPFLQDLRDEPWVAVDAARAEELRTDCRDSRITALLALGRAAHALAEVSTLRAADPLSDRGCWLQMIVLYRVGRVPEALAAYARHAKVLDDELGLEPSAELRHLQTAVLRQAPELAAWPRTPEWTGASDIVTPAASPVREAPSVTPPPRGILIGRDRELAAAADLLADVAAAAVRWLVLSGPPGIGKTRLAEEVVARLGSDEFNVVWVSCPDEQAIPAWWPMRRLLRALGEDPDHVLDVVDDADADTARFLVYERIQRRLESPQRPLVVVVDDVQWADPVSAGCLAYLAGALRSRPLAFVITLRDGEHGTEVTRLLSTVARGDGNRHISVAALAMGDVAALVGAIAADPITGAEAAALAQRTGGNPFFVSEYARLPRAERLGGEIPSGVKAVLDRRLARLAAPVINALSAAAVVGDVIDGDLVIMLAQATGSDIETLGDYFDTASDERIVVNSRSGDGYVFAHGLLREHLIAGMSAMRRQRLHATIAELLADRNVDGMEALRAHHLIGAQPLVEPGVVVAACRLAAEKATQQWSYDIAAHWWRAALDAHDRQPAAARDDVERGELIVAMLEAYSRAGRGKLVFDEVQRHLAEALLTGRPANAGRLASALLRTSGSWPWLAEGQDPGELLELLERAARLAGPDAATGARVLAALAVGHCYHPDPAVTAGYLTRAAELATSIVDPIRNSEAVADVLMGRLIAYSAVATMSHEIIDWADQLIALVHNKSLEDSVTAHAVASMALMNLADVSGCEARLHAAIDGSEALRLPLLRAQLRWMEANLAVWHGDFTTAERHLEIAARIYEQTELYRAGVAKGSALNLLRERGITIPGGPPDVSGNNWGRDLTALVHTVLLTMQEGQHARSDVRRHLTEWRDRVENRRHVWFTLGRLALLAQLAADHRLTEFCGDLLVELEPFADRIAMIGQTGVAGPVALAIAQLHTAQGERGAACESLAQALSVARGNEGAPSTVRCRLLECELEESPERRRQLARDVADAAERLGMLGVARRASTLLFS